MVSPEIRNRKGARKTSDIPPKVLKLLNQGEIPTVNLTEWLAVNQIKLIESTFPKIGLKDSLKGIKRAISLQKKSSTMSAIKVIGLQLYANCVESKSLSKTIKSLSIHQSDILRCYATYLIAFNSDLNIVEKLHKSKNLIADKHFGVREIVWMALRPEIEKNLIQSIDYLSGLANESDENLRRFALESIRPRGVWCKHLERLKENPELALPILEKLKSDKSKYVQASVGNWLNDASKSMPQFVIRLCEKWKTESLSTETEKIIKRSMRTIEKNTSKKDPKF